MFQKKKKHDKTNAKKLIDVEIFEKTIMKRD